MLPRSRHTDICNPIWLIMRTIRTALATAFNLITVAAAQQSDSSPVGTVLLNVADGVGHTLHQRG